MSYRKKYATDEMALELVNSENRKIIVNGFYLVSQNERVTYNI